jgi:hypothetical protein
MQQKREQKFVFLHWHKNNPQQKLIYWFAVTDCKVCKTAEVLINCTTRHKQCSSIRCSCAKDPNAYSSEKPQPKDPKNLYSQFTANFIVNKTKKKLRVNDARSWSHHLRWVINIKRTKSNEQFMS